MKVKRIVFLLLLLLGLCVGNSYVSKHFFTVTHYEQFSPKLQNTFRILHLTDLHNSEFGTSNESLLSKAAEQSPDLIVLTGDMLYLSTEN